MKKFNYPVMHTRVCGTRIDARIKINSVRQKAEISHQKDFPSR